jgi:hypothetical protein
MIVAPHPAGEARRGRILPAREQFAPRLWHPFFGDRRQFLDRQESSVSNEFKDKRRVWWIGGVALLVLGTLAAFIVLPARAPDVPAGPKIHVPAMQNVPSHDAPQMHLQ